MSFKKGRRYVVNIGEGTNVSICTFDGMHRDSFKFRIVKPTADEYSNYDINFHDDVGRVLLIEPRQLDTDSYDYIYISPA